MSNEQIPSVLVPAGPGNNWNDGTEHSARTFQQGKMIVELIPEGFILLDRELATGYHPALYAKLKGIPAGELEEQLATIAAYCGIVVEGVYTIQQRSELAAMCSGRLQVLRDIRGSEPPASVIILP
jgi:hypothetical protein